MSDNTPNTSDNSKNSGVQTDSNVIETFKKDLEAGNIPPDDLKTLLVEVVNENTIEEDEFASLLANVIIETTNSGTLRGDIIADEIGGFSTHSWLQRELFYGTILPLVEEIADTTKDGRNDDAVSSCESMVDSLDT